MPKKNQPAKPETHSEVPPPARPSKLIELAQKQNDLLIQLLKQEHESTAVLRKVVNQQKQFIETVSKRRFKIFLDSLPSLVVHIGIDQRVTFCNEGFTRFLGLTPRETIGTPIWEKLPTDYDSIRPRIVEALKGNRLSFEQLLHGTQNRYFVVTITPDFGLDDAVEGVFISLLDITDRRALEEKQRQSENQFRDLARERAELLKVKDDFLATVSHELRTPLTSIVGWAKLINSQTLSPDRLGEGLAAIERNAESQSRLIEDLLDLSRITSGKMQLEWSTVNIGVLVKQTVDSLRPAFDEKQLRIDLKVAEDMPPVRGDPERLQQVIMNLLSNALKFTPAGGRIQVEVNRMAAEVQLSVRDTGQGIPPEFLPHVFDEFRQADMPLMRQKRGLGLGLSIARRIVELHHGSISASSSGRGQGAKFLVNLPAA